jgi:hypothetical protein
MRRIERSTVFKRDYRRVKAISGYRDVDERLVPLLELLITTACCRRAIGQASGTAISGSIS